MGQRSDYLASNVEWHPSLSRDERLNRWAANASFGLALDGRAGRALAAADRAVAIAESARTMVLHQAVYALLDGGASVRETAERLGLSKSTVGRIAKQVTGKDGDLSGLAFVSPQGAADAIRDEVLEAWGFSGLDGTTVDHPHGTVEPDDAPTNPTNFGGLNA